MVSRKLHVIVTLAIVVLIADETSSQQVSCDNSTRYLERGKRAVISCEYSSSFIAVFWYRGQSSSPFLRLEQGKPTTEDGFGISSFGNMIIENVQISHGGLYRISVIDSNAGTSSGTVNVYVTVPLKNGLQLESCATSQQSLCQEISEEQRTLYLVCSATDTRPQVDFVWSKMSSNGRVNVAQVQCNSSVNSSTSLIKSSSILKYEKSDFSLQYFICTASGPAATGTPETGILVEGDKEVTKQMTKTETRSIQQRERLQMSCSTEPFTLSKWTILYPNKTMKLLRESYPGEGGGPCLSGFGCKVNEEGVLSFETISYLDEGSYICTYANGDTARRRITDVSVIIKPDPQKIIIEGCSEVNNCDKNVAFTGKLLASVTDARPSVQVMCEITREASNSGFLFNEKNEKVSHPERGTFDTLYSVEYNIEECSEPLSIICKVEGDFFIKTIPHSRVHLVTDASNCRKRRPGLVAFLVFFAIVVLLIIAVVILWRYREEEWVQKHLPQRFKSRSSNAAVLQMEETEPALEVKCEQGIVEERGEGEGEHMEVETKSVEEISQPLLHHKLMSAFKMFCEDLKATKRVPIKRFEDLMKLFQEHNESKSPGILLVDQMVEEDCENEMFPIVLEYLINPQGTKWVNISDVCKLLEKLTVSAKLYSGTSITIFFALFKDTKITLTALVEETGKLLKSGKFDEITILTNIKDLLYREKINQEQLVESILKYVYLYKMNEKTVLEEVKNLSKSDNKVQVPYPLFLREIQRLYKLEVCGEILFQLFQDIMKQFLITQWIQIVQEKFVADKRVITEVYIQVLIFSTVDGKISLERASSLLKSGTDKGEILFTDFKDAYVKILQDGKLEDEQKHPIRRTCLWMLKEVVSDGFFEDTVLTMISSKQSDENFWIQFIADLWEKDTTKTELIRKLFLQVASTYLILRKELKEPLDNTMGKDARKQILEREKFNDEDIKIQRKRAK